MSRRLIERLRALARSTTFPAERDSANAKADALEAKERMRDLHGLNRPGKPGNPYSYTWTRTGETEQHGPWNKHERWERKPKQPWRGPPGDHDALYAEELEQARVRNKDLKVSDRVREIIARREALNEMKRRFGLD